MRYDFGMQDSRAVSLSKSGAVLLADPAFTFSLFHCDITMETDNQKHIPWAVAVRSRRACISLSPAVGPIYNATDWIAFASSSLDVAWPFAELCFVDRSD